jgi:ATP-binding cassette subfamily B protein
VSRPAARRLLRDQLRAHRRVLALGAVAGIGWQAAAALAPLALGRGVDALAAGDTGTWMWWAAALLALGVLEAGCTALRHRQAITAYVGTTRLLRNRLLAAVLRHDDPARAATDPGRLTSLAETDVMRVSSFVDAVAHTIGYAVSVVVVAVLLVLTDPVLALCVLAPLSAAALLVLALRARTRRAWSDRQDAVAAATSTVVAGLGAHEALAGLGAGRHVADVLSRQTEQVRRRGLAVARVEALLETTVTALTGTGLALVLLAGGVRAAEGTIPVGTLVAAAGWALFLVVPVRTLAERVQTAQRALVSAGRLGEELDRRTHVVPPEHGRSPAGAGDVRLTGVSIAGLLHDVDLHVPAGGRLAVVDDGVAGSALAALLPRLRDPDSGTVAIDGADVRHLDLAALRRAVVLVPREPVLTGDTVADAVREGTGADDDEVQVALWTAAADDVLARGLTAPLGEQGAELSGGQRQRVALARALLAGPRILVLDGAASALDAVTEQVLVARLGRYLRRTGTSLVAVTDRAGLIGLADRVVTVHNGRLGPAASASPRAAPRLLDGPLLEVP